MPRKFAGISSLYSRAWPLLQDLTRRNARVRRDHGDGVPSSRPRDARTGITGRGRVTKTLKLFRVSPRIGGEIRYRNGPRLSGQQWIRVWFCDWELWLRMATPSQRVYIPTSCIQIMWFVGGLRTFWKFPSPLDERRGANRRGEPRRPAHSDRVSPFDRVKSNIEEGMRNEKVFRSRPRVHADLISPWIRFHEILRSLWPVLWNLFVSSASHDVMLLQVHDLKEVVIR